MVAGKWSQNRFGNSYLRRKIKETLAKNPQAARWLDADTQTGFDVGLGRPTNTRELVSHPHSPRILLARKSTPPNPPPPEVIELLIAKLASGEINNLNELELAKSRICKEKKCGAPRNILILGKLSLQRLKELNLSQNLLQAVLLWKGH